MRWSAGPKRLGCVYHERGVFKMADSSLLADVFVMPRIVGRRPIAVTIGRYRDYKAIMKREWQVSDPFSAMQAAEQVSSLFEEVGATAYVARQLGSEVCAFIVGEAPRLVDVLKSALPASDASPSGEPDDDIPF